MDKILRFWMILLFFSGFSEFTFGLVKDSVSSNALLEICTPQPKASPRINGPMVYGCRPGNPFLYRIPCQGIRPMKFSVKGLPNGLSLDASSGIISGRAPEKGEYDLLIQAVNSNGKDKRHIKIISGDQLALTPPMGWNSWYVHFNRVKDSDMRSAADAMISSGMADVGYQYVNIDDCWMNATATHKYMTDESRVGPLRDADGNIQPNIHFPDMKSLTGYIHGKGLKTGIYTSPGPNTCCGLAGSWQHEQQDAAQFAQWGFDFLKYDWCSYTRIAGKEPSLEEMQKPYILMGEALRSQPRDIVYNLCQYGMGKVWEWGTKVGGQCWRTAGDLGAELDRFFAVALKNAEYGKWSKPGSWNDPDYLQIGWIGAQKGATFTLAEPSQLSANEQYSYMSLWCMMASPLFFSGEMTKLDKFTLNVLCNPEIIEIDQDPLGKCAEVIRKNTSTYIMVKPLHDGTLALALFNQGSEPATVTADWSEINLSGKQRVRDLWRHKEMGIYEQKFSALIPSHGVVMVKLSKR